MSTPLPRLASAGAPGKLLPRLGTAAPTMPGTPPALSHYAEMTPARVRKLRPHLDGSPIRAPTEDEIERIRLEVEMRERAEAEFWGYGRKVRPGSRMGQDNRKMPQLPPWSQSPDVTYALQELERSFVPTDRLRRTGILDKLRESGHVQGSLLSNNYGRVVPYQLSKSAPLLANFTSDDMPVPKGKSEKGLVTMCEFSQAEGLLHDVLRARECDVLMGNQIPAYPEKLGPLIPRLRLCVLAGNGIGDRTLAIADGLRAAHNLTHLTLCQNKIGDQGCTYIAEVIGNTTLSCLDLQQNVISNEGAAAISVALTKCTCYEVMHKAVQEGQAAVVEAVIQHGFPVNPIFPGEEALLLKAASSGSASICEALLDMGADIEVKDSCNNTAVMLAAANGHKRVLTLLLDRGAEMNLRDYEGKTALMLAARYGHVECLQLLVGVAKLLPQRVGVYIRGIRDLQVHAPESFERIPSNASTKSKSSWGKVRGVALAIGSFTRITRIATRASDTGSNVSNTKSAPSSDDKEGIAGAESKADGITERTTNDAAQPASTLETPKKSKWGPGLLNRVNSMGSFMRRTSSFGSSTTTSKEEEARAIEKARLFELAKARSREKTFGRLPSTNSGASETEFGVSGTGFGGGYAVRTRLQPPSSCTISGHRFGHASAGDSFQRLPSVSEHHLVAEEAESDPPVPIEDELPGSQGSARPASRDLSISATSATSAGGRKFAFAALGRRPSLFQGASLDEITRAVESPYTTPDTAEQQGGGVGSAMPPQAKPVSRTAAALAQAPALRRRASLTQWSTSPEMLNMLKKDPSLRGLPNVGVVKGTNELPESGQEQEEQGGQEGGSGGVEGGSGRGGGGGEEGSGKLKLPLEATVVTGVGTGKLIKKQGVPRMGAILGKEETMFGRANSFGRAPSFGKRGIAATLGRAASISSVSSVPSDSMEDEMYVRISIGRLAGKQFFTSPAQMVKRKSGTIKMLSMHQFKMISSNEGANSRLKVELLYKDPEKGGETSCIGLCVQDLDDVLLGKLDTLDGWFVLHDFATRRRVGAVHLSVRSMPEQFYDTCFVGDNVLIHAARHGQVDCLRMLLDAGLSVSFPDRDGNTALIAAAKEGHRACVELLLRHGADIHIKNRGGLTAMDMAEKFEQIVICRVLRGVTQQKENVPFNIETWPADKEDTESPLDFLKDRYRGSYTDSLLVVKIVSARHLPKADVMGLSDPYITMNLNGVKFQSRVIKKTLQPVWNETVTVDDQTLGVWAGHTIHFEVYDYDAFGDADMLGKFDVDISNLADLQPPNSREMGEAWFPLRDENGKIVRGQHDLEKLKVGELDDSEVCLRFRFTPAAGRYLQLGVMEARHLPPKAGLKGKNPLPSAFVTVSMGDGSYRTEPIKKEVHPQWNTTYRFSAKSMSTWATLELHEVQLAKSSSGAGGKKILDPSDASLIGRARAPMHKLFSLSNAGLKDIWLELVDENGMKVKDAVGITSALRVVLNFVVLGEDATTWNSMSQLRIERNTKLSNDVVAMLSRVIEVETVDLEEDAMSEYQRLALMHNEKIPTAGMTEAAKTLKVDLSPDVIMLRLLLHTESGEEVCDFIEFCKVLNILQDEFEEPSPEKAASPTSGAKELIVNQDVMPHTGMRVQLCIDAIEKCPELLEDTGSGPGTIVWIDDEELAEGEPGGICKVMWDNTLTTGFYRTGFKGHYRLSVFKPPHSSKEQATDKMLHEIVIQKDVPARVGMRVIARKLALSLYRDLEIQARGKVGTIVWIEPANKRKRLNHAATVEVVWDGALKRRVVMSGLNGQYHLALHEEESKLTVQDIAILDQPHAVSFLQTVILDDNHIGDEGARALGEALRGNWMLKKLSLKRNRIRRDGGNAIGLGLKDNTMLQELYLNLNVLSDDGIVELCRALPMPNSAITTLDLEGNQLAYVACRLLARMLVEGKTLEKLLLNNNMVGGDGAGLLEQGLRHSKSLTYLNVERNVLGDVGMRCLMRAMRKIPPFKGKKAQPPNRALQILDVCHNNLSDACIDDVEESLVKNTSLRKILADNNVMTEKGLNRIERLLSENVQKAELQKAVITIQCLFRGRRARLALERDSENPAAERVFRGAPAQGDPVRVDNLPDNLKRYNGKSGVIESVEFDSDHRQWINVKLDDNVRTLPIRVPKKSVTVVSRPNTTASHQVPAPATAVPETPEASVTQMRPPHVVEILQHQKHLQFEAPAQSLTIHDGAAQESRGETPRSQGSASSRSGLSELARERTHLLTTLPELHLHDLVPSIMTQASPIASALLGKQALDELALDELSLDELALDKWPTSSSKRPSTLYDASHALSSSGDAAELERPKTYGGKSIKEQDLMMTAARLTLVNMGDALMQQQQAAEEIVREAGRKCMEAAQHYASLEAHLKAVILNEDTSEEDVKIALAELQEAERAAIRTMEEAEEAEEATRRAFHAMAQFEQFEQDERELEKAISGLNADTHGADNQDDDEDWANQLTDRIPESHISEEGSSQVASKASHITQEMSVRMDRTALTLEQSNIVGVSLSEYYRRLHSLLENGEADADSIETAVAEFNGAQDAALLAFDSAIKAVEEETKVIGVYQEDSQTFVDTVRQEMIEAFATLQAAQEADDDEAHFEVAMAEFSAKSAQMAQLVVRAEVFRLGSSWSQSSSQRDSHRDSPGRFAAVKAEVDYRLRYMRSLAEVANISVLNEQVSADAFYTAKEEAAALLMQSLMRGAKVRWQKKPPLKASNRLLANSLQQKSRNELADDMAKLFEKKYSEEDQAEIAKIQSLVRGGKDRTKVKIMKRMGRVAVNDFVNFVNGQSEEIRHQMDQFAAKIQSRFRGGKARTELKRSLTRSELMKMVIGTDLLGRKNVESREGRRHLAQRLVLDRGEEAFQRAQDEAKLEQEVAAVIIQKRVRGVQARGKMVTKSKGFLSRLTDGANKFTRLGMPSMSFIKLNMSYEIESVELEEAAHGSVIHGMQAREEKEKNEERKGLFGEMKKLLSADHHQESAHLKMIKQTNKIQAKMRAESLSLRQHSWHGKPDIEQGSTSGMSEAEQEVHAAKREAAALLGDLRQVALEQLETEMAGEDNLISNLVWDSSEEYSSEFDEFDDGPQMTRQASKIRVSFPTLAEFKKMQSNKQLEEAQEDKSILVVHMCGIELSNWDGLLGTSDPYLKFFRIDHHDGQQQLTEIGQSTVIQDDLNPVWPKLELSMKELCASETDRLFRIECWDSDNSLVDKLTLEGADDMMGWTHTTVDELFLMQPIALTSPDLAVVVQGSKARSLAAAAAGTAGGLAASALTNTFSGAKGFLQAGGHGFNKALAKVTDVGENTFDKVNDFGGFVADVGDKAGSKVVGVGVKVGGALGDLGTLGAVSTVGGKAFSGAMEVGGKGMGLVQHAGKMGGAMGMKTVGMVGGAVGMVGSVGQIGTMSTSTSSTTSHPGFVRAKKIYIAKPGDDSHSESSSRTISRPMTSLLETSTARSGTFEQARDSVEISRASSQQSNKSNTPAQPVMSLEQQMTEYFRKNKVSVGAAGEGEELTTKRPGMAAMQMREVAKTQTPVAKKLVMSWHRNVMAPTDSLEGRSHGHHNDSDDDNDNGGGEGGGGVADHGEAVAIQMRVRGMQASKTDQHIKKL